MNIVCVICSDLLVPSSDVFHTPCGHIFHFECLKRWLERSRTCPQCRERTTEHKIHRVYFNFSNNDSIVEDTATLQQRVESLAFQLKLKEKDTSNLKEAKDKLENVASVLRMEVKRVESEINGKNCVIHALKDQIKFYKQQCQDMDNQKKEIDRLKKHVENLKNLQSLMDASLDEPNEMITMTRDPSTLITYISVMKREMAIGFKKRRDLRDRVNKLQQELRHLTGKCASLTDEHIKRKELEKQLLTCESEKIQLQNQLHAEKEKVRKYICDKTLEEKPDSSRACEETNFEEESNARTPCNDTWRKIIKVNSSNESNDLLIVNTDIVENTPQNIKSHSFPSMHHGIKRTNSNVKVPSILAKRPKFSQFNKVIIDSGGITFDGFGGHAKFDKFPNPTSGYHVKKVRDETKMKKPKLDTGDNQKLSDMLLI